MNQITPRADRPNNVFTLLANQQRRSIVAYFRESPSDHATLAELATHVCEHSDDDHEQVTVDLRHRNLPKLSDAGVLEYDDRSQTIRYRGSTDVEELMDCLAEL